MSSTYCVQVGPRWRYRYYAAKDELFLIEISGAVRVRTANLMQLPDDHRLLVTDVFQKYYENTIRENTVLDEESPSVKMNVNSLFRAFIIKIIQGFSSSRCGKASVLVAARTQAISEGTSVLISKVLDEKEEVGNGI